MGADVVKIEPPGGDPARGLGPFIDDIPDRNRGLWWFAFNTSKRGITLDLEPEDGRALFKRMVGKADFVIESFMPGYLDSLGLGYSVLKAIKPDVILTSITPFGQTGPYKDFEAPDLILMAAGGFMAENGYPDSPPIRMSVDQAYHHGGIYGAAATLTAHWGRTRTGKGQHIDVCIQECLALMFDPPIQEWIMMRRDGTNRVGPMMWRGKVLLRLVWKCKDGYATWRLFTGQPVGRRTHKIIDWAEEDGLQTGLKGFRWELVDMLSITQEQLDQWDKVFHAFFEAHTKEQLVQGALKRNMMIYPVNTIADALRHYHFAARQFYADVEHPELERTFKYPGPFWKSHGAPWRTKGRAPLVGEHNVEFYGKELGLSPQDLSALRAAGVI
jgi:crotonobetainyl-CoA:carnitine CoA-transferase CaiB-like acyl-CoA transferase